MSWEVALGQLDQPGVVEFGIHQMNSTTGSPHWRRHKGGANFRFQSVRSALFSPDKGARAACLGKSTYAKARYSSGDSSVVPYACTWLQGSVLAFLARAGASEPEITLVPVAELDALEDTDHQDLLRELASIFGRGAASHGVRHLISGTIHVP